MRVRATVRVPVTAINMKNLYDLLPEYLKSPDTFNREFASVQEFAEWYISIGLPFLPPKNPHVYETDDARSIVLLRLGKFQVELYLMDSNPIMSTHGHPDIDVITIPLSKNAGITSFSFLNSDTIPSNTFKELEFSPVLTNGGKHGGEFRLEIRNGLPLLAFQHWKTREPTTVSAVWDGKLIGPKHKLLLERYNSTASISEDGYVVNT